MYLIGSVKMSSFVQVYTGVNKLGYIQPQTLARQDIVIVSYETLRKEIDYVDLPHTNSQFFALHLYTLIVFDSAACSVICTLIIVLCLAVVECFTYQQCPQWQSKTGVCSNGF